MIVIQFDSRYHRWAILLLRSLGLHEPGRRVLCDAVGLDRGQVAELERAHPGVICRNDPERRVISAAEMANRKPFVLRDALDRFPEEPWFCLLDADMLVRRPLHDLWSQVEANHAALIFTDGMWRGRFWVRLLTPSGVVLVRRDGRALVDRWVDWYDHDKPVGEVNPREWFWDQVTLFLAWCECGLQVASIPLSGFADEELAPASSIWSAHVPDKDGHFRRFQAELERQHAAVAGGEIGLRP